MRLAEKLAAFEQMALKAAEEKKRSAASDMESKFAANVDDALREDERVNRERLRNERYRIERDKNKHIVDVSGRAKRQFISQRERLTDALFEDIENDLRAFAASEEYGAYLLAKIKAVAASGKYEFVQLTADDMRFAPQISTETGLTPEEARDDFIGGFRLISPGRRSVADHTLAGRLAEQRAGFSMLVKEGND